jgi:hypothetical protein
VDTPGSPGVPRIGRWPWSRFVNNPDEKGIGTDRYPVIKPGTTTIAKELADRILMKP